MQFGEIYFTDRFLDDFFFFQSFMDNQNVKRLYNLQGLETLYIRNASAQFENECDMKKLDLLIEILTSPFQPMSFSLMR